MGKEKLNELLYLFSSDDKRYGLIFKLIYIYARNANEVLQLTKQDINFNDQTITFHLTAGDFTLPLHDDVKGDLVEFTNDLESTELLFMNVDESMEIAIKKLNYYLYKTIDSLNKTIEFEAPKLTTKDFKILRGQHLILDGTEIHALHQLYNNSNIMSTKNNINYNKLLEQKYPYNTIEEIFTECTDTNLYNDPYYGLTEIYTIGNEQETIIIEIDYENHKINLITEPEENKHLIEKTNQLLNDDKILTRLYRMKPGQYKYIDDLRFLKN